MTQAWCQGHQAWGGRGGGEAGGRHGCGEGHGDLALAATSVMPIWCNGGIECVPGWSEHGTLSAHDKGVTGGPGGGQRWGTGSGHETPPQIGTFPGDGGTRGR